MLTIDVKVINLEKITYQ